MTSIDISDIRVYTLSCGLDAKKLDVIIIRRLFKVKKSQWLFAVSTLTSAVPLIRRRK